MLYSLWSMYRQHKRRRTSPQTRRVEDIGGGNRGRINFCHETKFTNPFLPRLYYVTLSLTPRNQTAGGRE